MNYNINPHKAKIEDTDFTNTDNIVCGSRPIWGLETADNSIVLGYEITLEQNEQPIFTYTLFWNVQRIDKQVITDIEGVGFLLTISGEAIINARSYLMDKYGITVDTNEPIFNSARIAVSQLRQGGN